MVMAGLWVLRLVLLCDLVMIPTGSLDSPDRGSTMYCKWSCYDPITRFSAI